MRYSARLRALLPLVVTPSLHTRVRVMIRTHTSLDHYARAIMFVMLFRHALRDVRYAVSAIIDMSRVVAVAGGSEIRAYTRHA